MPQDAKESLDSIRRFPRLGGLIEELRDAAIDGDAFARKSANGDRRVLLAGDGAVDVILQMGIDIEFDNVDPLRPANGARPDIGVVPSGAEVAGFGRALASPRR
ncbi:MAG TPA: hypothetical protein VFE62_12445 [Gemmataceae bacterium]|nr:hypothetical protein [Gemmataceae bacterium]